MGLLRLLLFQGFQPIHTSCATRPLFGLSTLYLSLEVDVQLLVQQLFCRLLLRRVQLMQQALNTLIRLFSLAHSSSGVGLRCVLTHPSHSNGDSLTYLGQENGTDFVTLVIVECCGNHSIQRIGDRTCFLVLAARCEKLVVLIGERRLTILARASTVLML